MGENVLPGNRGGGSFCCFSRPVYTQSQRQREPETERERVARCSKAIYCMQPVILDPSVYCVLNGQCSGPNETSSRVLERKVNRGLSFFSKKDFFKISSRLS
jgi:hypothetical protein